MQSLVPGRECSDCNLCCIVPAIDKPEIQKTTSSVCRNCGDGCAIYEARPEVCRNYYCGWRRLSLFGEDWRPDLSGVFAELQADVPPQFNAPFGINLILVGNPLRTVREQRFCDFVVTGLNKNIPLFLGLPGPKAKQGAMLPLNTQELAAAARTSRSAVKQVLEKTLKRLAAHDFVPYAMEFSGADCST